MTPRQRNVSGPAYACPGTSPYVHPAQLVPSPAAAGRYDPQYQPPVPIDYVQHGGQSGDWQAGPQRRISDTPQAQQSTQYQPDSNARLRTSTIASTRDVHTDWGSARAQDNASWNTGSRRPTRASISDRSDASASSRSDASGPRSISEDLQGLSLGDHPSSQLIPPPGASPRSQRWDPILGDVQRNHDALVVSSTTVYLERAWADIFSDCHLSLPT